MTQFDWLLLFLFSSSALGMDGVAGGTGCAGAEECGGASGGGR